MIYDNRLRKWFPLTADWVVTDDSPRCLREAGIGDLIRVEGDHAYQVIQILQPRVTATYWGRRS